MSNIWRSSSFNLTPGQPPGTPQEPHGSPRNPSQSSQTHSNPLTYQIGVSKIWIYPLGFLVPWIHRCYACVRNISPRSPCTVWVPTPQRMNRSENGSQLVYLRFWTIRSSFAWITELMNTLIWVSDWTRDRWTKSCTLFRVTYKSSGIECIEM